MVTIKEVAGRSDLRRFIGFPYDLYAGEPCWVPPLRSMVRRQLRRHPFHRYARSRYFLALDRGRVQGRVAAILNPRYNEFQGTNVGFFGYFECRDDPATARALLDAAIGALREHGVERVLGPASPSSNAEFGLLIDGFDRPPALIMPYHRRYYRGLIEGYGFVKAKDLFAYEVRDENIDQRVLDLFDRIGRRQHGIAIREVDTRRLREEVETVFDLYHQAWERNWGFCPMTEEELRFEAHELRTILDPRIALFIEADGKPVAFTLSLPDYNIAIRHARGRLFPFGLVRILYHARSIHTIRTILLGVVEKYRDRGLEGVLVGETISRGRKAGYNVCECSWILEDNLKMRRVIEKIGGTIEKTYRVYEIKV